MRHDGLQLIVISLAALASLPTSRADEIDDEGPYLYQRQPGVAPLRVEAESAVGTRDTRSFGQRGVEETLRLAFRPLSRLEVVLAGSSLFVDGDSHVGGALEATYAVLDERSAPLTLRIGGGVGRDLTGATVLRSRLLAARSFGDLELGGGVLVELPIGVPGRDEADYVVNLAAALRVAPRLRIGVELAGEDLEGLFETEAEGGARVIVGPTLWAALGRHVDVKISAAAAEVVGQGAGFLGRAALGFSF